MNNEQLTKEIVKLHEQLAEAKGEHDKFQIMLDELKEVVKENRELTIAVKEIATEMKHLREEQTSMRKQQGNMNERIKLIEEKPFKEYEETKKQVKKQILAFFVGIILTILAFGLGLNKFI